MCSWHMLPPMHTPRTEYAAATLAGQLYIVGGRDEEGAYIESVERFDPGTYAWQAVPPLPAMRFEPSACVVSDKLYIIGFQDELGDADSDEEDREDADFDS